MLYILDVHPQFLIVPYPLHVWRTCITRKLQEELYYHLRENEVRKKIYPTKCLQSDSFVKGNIRGSYIVSYFIGWLGLSNMFFPSLGIISRWHCHK